MKIVDLIYAIGFDCEFNNGGTIKYYYGDYYIFHVVLV